MRGMPDAAVGREGEPVGCRLSGFGHPEVDPCRSHADGTYGHRAVGPTRQGRRQPVVGGFECAERREPRAPPRDRMPASMARRGEGEFRIGLLGRDLTKEPGTPGPPSQRRAGEGAHPQRGQLGQVHTHGSGTFEGSGVRQHQRFIPEGQGWRATGAEASVGDVAGSRRLSRSVSAGAPEAGRVANRARAGRSRRRPVRPGQVSGGSSRRESCSDRRIGGRRPWCDRDSRRRSPANRRRLPVAPRRWTTESPPGVRHSCPDSWPEPEQRRRMSSGVRERRWAIPPCGQRALRAC